MDPIDEEFYEELARWRKEIFQDIELITEGIKVQGESGKSEALKFYRGLSHKILKWKDFVRETNAEQRNK